MNWRAILSGRKTEPCSPPPVTCAEAGQTGYIVRHERERAHVRAKCREICADMGRPVPEALR